jgi:hypothetical protein
MPASVDTASKALRMRIKLVSEPTVFSVSKEENYLLLPDFVKTIALWMFPGFVRLLFW